jgi:Phosphate-selective porin O and P
VIQLGKRNSLCTLLTVTALGISANAFAQAPAPAPPPAPPPTEPAAPTDPSTATPPPTTPPPAPAPTPPPEPPKAVYPTMAGPALKLSDLFTFRPGILLQFWAQAAQDSLPKADGSSGGFSKNFYLRRARFFVGGGLGKNITYFLLWESANVGLATSNADGSVNKNFGSFAFNDAYLDFKFNPNVSIQAGLMLIPFTRNILQSTSTYWTLDIGGVSASYIGVTQTNVLRDTGVQVKINAADGKLEARGMISQGVKQADPEGGGRTPGKNDPRLTGYIQYNFLEPEAGYVFNGMYFGRKAVAGIALGGDYQSIADNAYFATSATAYATIPLKGADPKNGGDEVGGQVEFLHFHGGGALPAAGLGKRNDLLVEAGYYNKDAKLSVFGKFEGVFIDGAGDVGNTRLFGGGLKYFLAEQIANLTLQYSLTQFPNQPSTARNSANSIQLQLQLTYF